MKEQEHWVNIEEQISMLGKCGRLLFLRVEDSLAYSTLISCV